MRKELAQELLKHGSVSLDEFSKKYNVSKDEVVEAFVSLYEITRRKMNNVSCFSYTDGIVTLRPMCRKLLENLLRFI